MNAMGLYLTNILISSHPFPKENPPVPLRIMTYGEAITRETFEAMKNVLYRSVYKYGVL